MCGELGLASFKKKCVCGGGEPYKHVNIPIKDLERFPFSLLLVAVGGRKLQRMGILMGTSPSLRVKRWRRRFHSYFPGCLSFCLAIGPPYSLFLS